MYNKQKQIWYTTTKNNAPDLKEEHTKIMNPRLIFQFVHNQWIKCEDVREKTRSCDFSNFWLRYKK